MLLIVKFEVSIEKAYGIRFLLLVDDMFKGSQTGDPFVAGSTLGRFGLVQSEEVVNFDD